MVLLDAVVISLASATERRAEVIEQFSACPFPWRIFDALTPDCASHPRYEPAQARRFMGRDLSRGEIGCFLSHYHVMREFVEKSGPDWLLVFEDDVDVDFRFKFDEAVKFCEKVGAKYMRLYARHHEKGVRLGSFYYYNFIRYSMTPTGTQCYLVHREFAASWVQQVTTIRQTIDLQLESFWRYRAPIYGIHPFPVMERFSPSTLARVPSAPLSFPERAASLGLRAVEKARKMIANRLYATSDAKLRRLTSDYHEI
ncbi:hypothetical protein GC169_08160 [bacterium]|nr:hypothetical protein [bacterium]